GLAEISNIMQRQRELAVQGANDTLTTTERTYIANEINQLAQEIVRISKTTDYNSINMLGSFGTAPGPQTLHVGANSIHGNGQGNNVICISYGAVVSAISISETGAALKHQVFETALGSINDLLKDVNGIRANIGTYINRLEYTINNIANLEFNTQDAESRIRDTDFAKETTNFTRNQIMVQSATSMLAQANSLPQSVLGLLG
ncbi:MAG: flagellin, partial [Fibromonadales bacterium]|nr:flagellin [Fibromonadales bacterium]